MTTMAEVLAEHQRKTGVRDMLGHCWCGWAGGRTDKAFVEHQSATLTAAGFGPVRTDEQRLMLAATLAYDAIEDSALQQAREIAFNYGWREGKGIPTPCDLRTGELLHDEAPTAPFNPYREDAS